MPGKSNFLIDISYSWYSFWGKNGKNSKEQIFVKNDKGLFTAIFAKT